MKEIDLAMTLIEQGDSYVLQLRNFSESRGGAGLIGCFGGEVEPSDASPQHAALRELQEETNLNPNIDGLERLGKVKVVSDRNHSQIKVRANVFRLVVLEDVEINALDGEKEVIPKSEISNHLGRMTSATRASFRELILE